GLGTACNSDRKFAACAGHVIGNPMDPRLGRRLTRTRRVRVIDHQRETGHPRRYVRPTQWRRLVRSLTRMPLRNRSTIRKRTTLELHNPTSSPAIATLSLPTAYFTTLC